MVLIITSILFLVIDNSVVEIASADSSDNVSGYAWNDNIGWISFNCTNDDTCATSNYGVNIAANGSMSGYAWNDNIGWIDFSLVSYNSVSREFSGVAQIISLGSDGYIQMNDTDTGDGIDYGVSLSASGEFEGWAWNNGDGGNGIGWVSFNCSDTDSCGSSGYRVQADIAVEAPSNLVATPQSCLAMRLDWIDNSSNETGFIVEYSETGNFTGEESTFCSIGSDINYCTSSMPPSTTYYFRVKATGSSGDSSWSPVSGGAAGSTSFCSPDGLVVDSYNCTAVNLSWTQVGDGVDHYDMMRNKDSEGFVKINTSNIPGDQLYYVDEAIESGASYVYQVVAVDSEGSGSSSDPTEELIPCPNLPDWKEIGTR